MKSNDRFVSSHNDLSLCICKTPHLHTSSKCVHTPPLRIAESFSHSSRHISLSKALTMTRRFPFVAGLLFATALASFTAFSSSSSRDLSSRPMEAVASAASPRTLLQTVEDGEEGGATQSATPTELPATSDRGAGDVGGLPGGDEGPGGLPMRVEVVSGGRGERGWMDG